MDTHEIRGFEKLICNQLLLTDHFYYRPCLVR